MRTKSRRLKGFKELDTSPEEETRRVQPVASAKAEAEVEEAAALDVEDEAESEIENENDAYDPDDDYDPEEERRARVATLNRNICIVLGVVVTIAVAALIIQNGSNKPAVEPTVAAPKKLPNEKPAPTFTVATNTAVNATDWTISKVNGSYRANGKRIMGNWTLQDDNNNVQYLSPEEKKALSVALNKFDEQHPH